MNVAAFITVCILCGSLCSLAQPAGTPLPTRNIKVYFKRGKFGGWPANHGIWSWGDEILVGFSAGDYKDLGPSMHNIDRDKPERHLFARSLDGGETWSIEDPSKDGVLLPEGKMLHGTELPNVTKPPWTDCPGNINFQHPDFAMTLRLTDNDGGPSRFFYSTDRGHHWLGPYRLPAMGLPGIAARTDMVVEGPHSALFFLTAAKTNNHEGRPFCARTDDGGKSFQFVSFIGEVPSGYAIMPATVRTSPDSLYTVVRCSDGNKSWLTSYGSQDNGRSWSQVQANLATTGEGNPAALIKLADGRLFVTYAVRSRPYRLCAKLSADNGRTWDREIVLRKDGSSRDIGYPRCVQRKDGNVVIVYYYSDAKTGPERYIAATIWKPSVTNQAYHTASQGAQE